MNQHILVTGGSGMVGRFLREVMPDACYLSSSDYDLRKESEVENLFATLKPEIVIHLAARVGGILDNIKYPSEYFDDNILMNTFLVKHAHRNNCKKLIAILSTCIYPDKASTYPMTETLLHEGPPTATNFTYGYAKRALAVQIEAYNQQYKTNFNYLIPSNLYGEYDHFDFGKSHFVSALIRKIYEAKKNHQTTIQLLGSGTPLRQFIYAKDLARVIKLVIENDIDANFNVAGDENLSIREIAEIALRACDAEHLQIEFDATKPDGQYRKDVSNEKMKTLFPDFKFASLYEGIKLTFEKMETTWDSEYR